MPLKMRPTGLGSGTYKDNVDYSVFSSEWLIGRIYERNGFPDEVLALCRRDRPPCTPMALLREAEEPKDFARPISYPKLGIVYLRRVVL
jgi:hypothetical protein